MHFDASSLKKKHSTACGRNSIVLGTLHFSPIVQKDSDPCPSHLFGMITRSPPGPVLVLSPYWWLIFVNLSTVWINYNACKANDIQSWWINSLRDSEQCRFVLPYNSLSCLVTMYNKFTQHSDSIVLGRLVDASIVGWWSFVNIIQRVVWVVTE